MKNRRSVKVEANAGKPRNAGKLGVPTREDIVFYNHSWNKLFSISTREINLYFTPTFNKCPLD